MSRRMYLLNNCNQKGQGGRSGGYMHAWPEVYLPGGGWRGFDPTHGLVVAAARPEDAAPAPIAGGFHGGAHSSLHAEVHIDVDA